MPFETLDQDQIAAYGREVMYLPGGIVDQATEVRVIVSDPIQGANGALLQLFGTMTDSGFPVLPAKTDLFEIDDVSYRVFEVTVDQLSGIQIALTR